MQKLIHLYLELFTDVPSHTNVLCHNTEVDEHAPIKQHAYWVNLIKRSIIKSEVDYLVDHGLAVPSCSDWSSPCILVPKPDGTFYFCTDYRKVNAITKPDLFPLLLMEHCVDKISSTCFNSNLDLLEGYWQVPLTPRAAEISAFVTPGSFMQYSVMAFELRNTLQLFNAL